MGGAKQAPVSIDRTDTIVNTWDSMLDAYEHWKGHEASIHATDGIRGPAGPDDGDVSAR